MKRGRLATAAVVAGIVIGGLAGIAADDDDGGKYLVRAVFDNGSFVIPGEDVKIAGVKVGSIYDVDLTEENKAAVVLEIDDPAFRPFRSDAGCQIRLQSLIGEQFIECQPTRARKPGEPPAKPLAKIESGRGEGQYLLPVDNNTTPVAIDLLQNINRMPQREGFRLLLNEFGAGLAGNGDELRAAIRRANPALRETDRVIKVLADQHELLANLIDASDRVLGPWAAKRKETAGFIDHAGAVAAATAERGDALEQNFAKFPAFLRVLKPTTEDLSGFAQQMAPALDNLYSQAPAINEVVERLGPFTAASAPALVSLGDFADEGRRLFPAIEPLVQDLAALGKPLRPASDDLAKLFSSFDERGGIEELMKLIYFFTGASNGEDQFGHFVRSNLSLGACSARVSSPAPGCSSKFDSSGEASTAVSSGELPLALQPKKDSRLREDAEAAGFDLDSKQAEPLLQYLMGPDGAEGDEGAQP